MKILITIVSVLIAIQAISLFYSPVERQNFHEALTYINNLSKEPLLKCCCTCFQEFRIITIAFSLAAAFLLFTNEAIFPAIIAQLIWISTQNLTMTCMTCITIQQGYQLLTSVLILLILFSEYCAPSIAQKKSKTVEQKKIQNNESVKASQAGQKQKEDLKQKKPDGKKNSGSNKKKQK